MYNKNITKGIILSFISLILLGIMPIISNSRPMKIDALHFALYLSIWQLIFSVPVLFFELRNYNQGIFSANLPNTLKKKTISIILVTGIMFGISTFAYVFSMEKAGATSAAIAIQAYPLFAILWETIFLNKRKSIGELFFTILLISGLYYLGTGGTWKIKGLSYWFLSALSVPFIWSVAHVIVKEVLDKTPITPAQVTFFRVSISAVFLFVIAVYINDLSYILNLLSSSTFQIYAAIMGFIYYLELINWFYAVKHVDVSVASSITAPWPVITIILAILFLQETVKYYQIITMITTLISVYGLIVTGRLKNSKSKITV
ncbi:EamA domain-containing membrane protein RarD [Desulfonauticus submarinus]|uniref:EamA domain-containing membrane protein RarD n=1 Tax=Desulfonauticus submarinus TaxID=206665 RepID=A0A1H0B3A1_9BACT|nr:EamA family transporter [Desulfonauticus submarinus]SDN40065.1 EamA domain-containing membrane protein RarD [Desulfonauticus submarinus]